MKKSTGVLAGAGAVAVVAVFVWAFSPRPVEVEVASVTQGRFEATIEEDGRTRVRDRYVVSAPLAGQLLRIALREGDVVQAGDLIAMLAPALSPLLDERTLREQRLRVRTAEAQVEHVNARIARVQVLLEQAVDDLLRSESLARDGFISTSKLESDRLGRRAAQKELEAAHAERSVALYEAAQARAALSVVQRGDGARGFALRAPVAGRVLRVAQPSEASVALGTPLVELGDTSRMEVVAELLTTDALQVAPGSQVIVERWGGAGVLQGRVRLIEPGAFTKVSALGVEEQRVRVLIELTSPHHEWHALGDGYRVGVRIITLTVDRAVRVPVAALFPLPGENAGMAVFVLERGRARLVPVDVGMRSGNDAWVRKGVEPGTSVIIYPPPAVAHGARVRVRRAASAA